MKMKSALTLAAGLIGVLALVAVVAAADKPPAAGAKPAMTAGSKPAPTAAPATAAAVSAAPGVPEAPLAPPKPGVEHEALKFYTGNWKCTGKWEASPMGPAKAVEATNKGKVIFGGLYVNSDYAEKKTKENPYPITGRMTLGYDAMAKHYTASWISSWGEQVLSTSKGWEGDKLVWVSEGMAGPGSKWTETHTKTGDKALTIAFDMTVAGKTTPAGTLACKKP